MRKYLTWVMLLTISTYLIIAIALVILLTGCSQFEAKIEEMNIITQPALDEQMNNDGLQQ